MLKTSSKSGRDLIENLCDIQDKYKAAKAEADKLKAEFDAEKQVVLEYLQAIDSDSAKADGFATVSIDRKEVPTVEDWEAVAQFVRDNDALYLFQRRLNASAVKELKEGQGLEVPGVSMFSKQDLRIARLRK